MQRHEADLAQDRHQALVLGSLAQQIETRLRLFDEHGNRPEALDQRVDDDPGVWGTGGENGNVIGSPIGSASQLFDANSNQTWSTTIVFDHLVQNLRVEKSFSLDATSDTQALDLVRVALVDQNIQVVPEPATLCALALGAIGSLACRRRK